jgi:hypothetical protein
VHIYSLYQAAGTVRLGQEGKMGDAFLVTGADVWNDLECDKHLANADAALSTAEGRPE